MPNAIPQAVTSINASSKDKVGVVYLTTLFFHDDFLLNIEAILLE
jgi:hypothetical protein